MKEVKHYICEMCGTEYNDKIKAQQCENGHKKPVEIIKASYVSITNDNTGYPMRITVKMSDGSEQIYRKG
jgi:hypothetical protein